MSKPVVAGAQSSNSHVRLDEWATPHKGHLNMSLAVPILPSHSDSESPGTGVRTLAFL